jgi:nicotinate-nucleotide adenylyltransferase
MINLNNNIKIIKFILMNIALLGGSFNPITKAHINLAKIVINSNLKIDEVWLLPSYNNFYKKQLVSDNHRINMCKHAIENEPEYKIKVCDFEIKNKIIGSTATVLKELYKNYNHNFKFIIGMDNANNIYQWSDYQITLNLIPFIVIDRIEFNKPIKQWYLNHPHSYINVNDENNNYVSSTLVRNLIKENKPTEKYLYNNVYQYIKKFNLF